MSLTVRLALRDWDYLTPLLLGDVADPRIELRIDRVGTLVEDLAKDAAHDGAEISFSRHVQAVAGGAPGVVGVPCFLMRGFRHRCILTTRSGPTRIEDLAGARIGVTGWQDSGNTWTRAVLAEAGVGVEDATWFAGRLTAAHPVVDRLGRFARPGRIEAMPREEPMMQALEAGRLDAVFTPFMPEGFFRKGSPFRHVLEDFRSAEIGYFRRTGYVPGMHILALKPELVAAHPWLAAALTALFDRSLALWLGKRRKHAETTPWILQDIATMDRELGEDWAANGIEANAPMIGDFLGLAEAQGLISRRPELVELFPTGEA